VQYYDATTYFCPGGICSTNAPDGELLYHDPWHLSAVGSWKLGELIVRTAGVPEPFTLLR
jgi:hypothetical protein